MSDIKMVEAPKGLAGEGFFATTLDQVVGLARSKSMWPLPFLLLHVVESNSWLPWPLPTIWVVSSSDV